MMIILPERSGDVITLVSRSFCLPLKTTLGSLIGIGPIDGYFTLLIAHQNGGKRAGGQALCTTMATRLVNKCQLVCAEFDDCPNVTRQTSLAWIATLAKIPIYLSPIHNNTSIITTRNNSAKPNLVTQGQQSPVPKSPPSYNRNVKLARYYPARCSM
jgi:hypothetical protein